MSRCEVFNRSALVAMRMGIEQLRDNIQSRWADEKYEQYFKGIRRDTMHPSVLMVAELEDALWFIDGILKTISGVKRDKVEVCMKAV